MSCCGGGVDYCLFARVCLVVCITLYGLWLLTVWTCVVDLWTLYDLLCMIVVCMPGFLGFTLAGWSNYCVRLFLLRLS